MKTKYAAVTFVVSLGLAATLFAAENQAGSPTLTGPNQILFDYLGSPVAPPTNMNVAYTKKGLTSAMQTAAKDAGITLTKLEIEDSEFPFLVGVICANQQDMEKLKEQIRKMPAYNYTGGVGGGRSASYAMNLVPYTAFPAEASQRIHHRMSLREEIFYGKMHENQ